jgi:hypothetical protein
MNGAETSHEYSDLVYNIVASGSKWIVQKSLPDKSWVFLGRFACREAASAAVSVDKELSLHCVHSTICAVHHLQDNLTCKKTVQRDNFFGGIRRTARSGYGGVYKVGNRWKAQAMSRDGARKKQYLGMFTTKEEAAAVVAAYEGGSTEYMERKPVRIAPQHLPHQKGVRKYHNLWRAESYGPGHHRKHVGLFKTKVEAFEALKLYEAQFCSGSQSNSDSSDA